MIANRTHKNVSRSAAVDVAECNWCIPHVEVEVEIDVDHHVMLRFGLFPSATELTACRSRHPCHEYSGAICCGIVRDQCPIPGLIALETWWALPSSFDMLMQSGLPDAMGSMVLAP